MKTSFMLVLIFTVSYAQGQGYYPLTIGDLWQYWEVPGQYWNVQVVGDTLMPNNTTYMVLIGDGGWFLRQSGPLVLAYSPPQNEEFTLYDFSKTTGDTVTIRYYPADTIVVTVESDQMETHFGRTLRTWLFYERSTTSSWYARWRVADSLGLVSAQMEPGFGYGLQGAIISGVQYGVVLDVSMSNAHPLMSFSLSQNYPNPFNPRTSFEFRVLGSELVTLKVYDLLGREVATLVDEEMGPGTYEVQWDASGHASGVYVYRLQSGTFADTKKLLLLR